MNPGLSMKQRPGAALLFLIGLVALAGCHKPADGDTAAAAPAKPAASEPASAGVSLTPEEIAKIGVTTVTAQAAQHAAEVAGFAVVVAREPFAQAVSDVATAGAVERQSQAALKRAQGLSGTMGAVSTEILEAATRQAAVDHAASNLARQRLSASFGRSAPWRNAAGSPLLNAVAEGTVKLVRVTFPIAVIDPAVPRRLTLARIGASTSGSNWTATLSWEAPADAEIPGTSFFAVLKDSDVREGERLLAMIPRGPSESGVWVPAAAAVIHDGNYWCYVERKPGSYKRVPMDSGVPMAGGYFVKQGVAAGDKIVVTAAGLLLARETNLGASAE